MPSPMSKPSAPRRLLTGPAGSGKTTAVLEAVRDALAAGREMICLLPTYGQVEHTKRRFLTFCEREAEFDPRFLTFTGLYELLLRGRRVRHLAPRPLRRRLMERAIEETPGEVFRAIA